MLQPTNPKSQLFAALKLLLVNEKTGVKSFKYFNNQFVNEKKESPTFYPAILLEFVAIDWISKGESLQEGDLLLRFHVGVEALKDQEEKVLDIIDRMHFFLQNHRFEDLTTPLDRKSEKQDTDHDGLIVWQVDYVCQFTDNTAARKRKLVRMESIDTLDNNKDVGDYYLKPLE